MPTTKSRARRPLSEQERARRRAADRELAAQAVAELLQSEGWQRWLTSRAAFSSYSLSNQLLIAHQRPTACRVAGFRAWQNLGYQVQAGERAIRIWMPLTPSKKQIAAWHADGADPDERPRVLFKLGPVFSDDQVTAIPGADPAPLRPPACELTGSELDWTLGPLTRLAGELGCAVQIAEMPDGVGGSYRPATGQITLADGKTPNHRVHTLIHELTHRLVHQDREQGDEELPLSYAQEELVVESVTYTVLMGLGSDPGPYAVPYLASWSGGDLTIVEQTAQAIDRYARVLEDVLDAAPARIGAGAAGEEEHAG